VGGAAEGKHTYILPLYKKKMEIMKNWYACCEEALQEGYMTW
jgi:hypothetical protein